MNATGAFTGQTFQIFPSQISGTTGDDVITLTRDQDGVDIDWVLGTANGQFPINDPNGLTIVGGGGHDTINLDYSNGNPLPNKLHLNGTFTVNGLQGASPFSGTTVEIGRSTVFISYGGA